MLRIGRKRLRQAWMRLLEHYGQLPEPLKHKKSILRFFFVLVKALVVEKSQTSNAVDDERHKYKRRLN